MLKKGDGQKIGIARLRLPEKLARTISESELPVLDRPLRFIVIRGQRGAIRADTLRRASGNPRAAVVSG
jgi:hypothetical protein